MRDIALRDGDLVLEGNDLKTDHPGDALYYLIIRRILTSELEYRLVLYDSVNKRFRMYDESYGLGIESLVATSGGVIKEIINSKLNQISGQRGVLDIYSIKVEQKNEYTLRLEIKYTYLDEEYTRVEEIWK